MERYFAIRATRHRQDYASKSCCDWMPDHIFQHKRIDNCEQMARWQWKAYKSTVWLGPLPLAIYHLRRRDRQHLELTWHRRAWSFSPNEDGTTDLARWSHPVKQWQSLSACCLKPTVGARHGTSAKTWKANFGRTAKRRGKDEYDCEQSALEDGWKATQLSGIRRWTWSKIKIKV